MVDPHQVPDDVLAVLLEHIPEDRQHAAAHREEWRLALAHALTRWERDQPYDQDAALSSALVQVHQCKWRVIGVKSSKIIGIPQTYVLQVCDCGDVRTVQMQGEWTFGEVTEGRQP